MGAPLPRLSWYRSFYWRIGLTFVASVVVVLITKGVILRRIPRHAPFDVFQGPVLAAEAAVDVADVLRRGQEADLRAKKLRGRNLAVLAALLALVALFYAITVVRMSGAH